MEIFDNSWVEEYEKLEKDYEMFYKENVENVKLFFLYINKNKNIENIHQDSVILTNGILSKELVLNLINQNKIKNGIRYNLTHLLKYNISLDPTSVDDFLSDKINETYLNSVNFLEDIYFKKTISILQDLNCLYFILYENETNGIMKILTRKNKLFVKQRKTRRKIT